MKKMALILISLACIAAAAPVLAADGPRLPAGYVKWEKSREKVITDKKSLFYGIHYIYVDKKAMKAYKAGGSYPEGSRFVVVNYNIREEGGKAVKGKKSMVVLMKKERKQQTTGGWLFAGFGPDGKPSGLDPVKNCYECHLKEAKGSDLVISKYADFK